MLKRNAFPAVLFLCLLTSINYTNAQSLQSMENILAKLQNNFAAEIISLDSLKIVLNKSAKEIDAEKRKRNADENKIKNLMAASVTITNQIEAKQKSLDKLNGELSSIKTKLDKKYSSIIDSLSQLENSNKFKGDKKELRAQILKLTEKKILVSPAEFALSFNPGKILEIDPAKTKTVEEKNIYKEYLTGALNEVDNQLEQITKLNKEVKQIITLQEKTQKFLEQAEFSSDITSRSVNVGGSDKTRDGNSGTFVTEEAANIGTQIQSFSFLLKQLNLTKEFNAEENNHYSLDSLRTNLTINEYQNLLDEIISKLSDYKLILDHKLDAYK